MASAVTLSNVAFTRSKCRAGLRAASALTADGTTSRLPSAKANMATREVALVEFMEVLRLR